MSIPVTNVYFRYQEYIDIVTKNKCFKIRGLIFKPERRTSDTVQVPLDIVDVSALE